MIFTNLEEELMDRLIPALSQILILLQEMRSDVRAKEELASHPSFDSVNTLGLSTVLHIQPLINYAAYLQLMFERLLRDLAYCKSNLRNFFVFLNTQIIKLYQISPN